MPNEEEADRALKGLDKYHLRGYNINVEVIKLLSIIQEIML